MGMKLDCRAFLFLLTTCLLSFGSESAATYASLACPDTTSYAPNSIFRANRNLLLSQLSSNATVQSGFYNATAGQSSVDTAYGLFLCRGDLSPERCQDCVSTATREVVETYCPNRTRVVIWYEECMLRYSNKSIFSFPDMNPGILYNKHNVTDPEQFTTMLSEVMRDMERRAASGRELPGKKFALAQLYYSALQTLHAMAQCTPDISSDDCTKCLETAISSLPSCCYGSLGVRVMFPSCNIRYEMYPFYNTTAFPPPPTPSPPALPSPPTSSGEGGISSGVLVAIIVPVGVSVLLFIVGFCFLRKRAKKVYQPVREDTGEW